MKKVITTTMVAGLLVGGAMAEVTTTFDFASAYVFRGVTYNDGPVFQPGIEATGLGVPESWGAVTVGAWGNWDIDDYNGALNSSEFSEIDWYASYSLPQFVENLDLFLGYIEYTYPGTFGQADKEVNLGVAYEIAGIGLGYTLNVNVDTRQKYSYNLFEASYGLDISEALAASVFGSVAYFTTDAPGGTDGLADGTLGADLSYALGDVWSVGASLTYIAQLDDQVLTDAVIVNGVPVIAGYDVDLVGMLSFGATF